LNGAIDLADRMAILDLYARQSHLIDGGDAQGWAETFTVDGSFESPTYGLTATGRAALRDFADASNTGALERGVQFRHWTNQYVFEPHSPTEVAVEAYMLIIATSGEGSRVDRSLRVFDLLSKSGGQWRFRSRRIVRDG
jgi:hypothetical protein